MTPNHRWQIWRLAPEHWVVTCPDETRCECKAFDTQAEAATYTRQRIAIHNA